jgi:hypothetical protein
MAYRVTKPITKHGRVYAKGDIVDDATSVEQSMARLLQWETVSDPAPSISGLRKPQLVELAEVRGFDVEGLTKAELVDLLED